MPRRRSLDSSNSENLKPNRRSKSSRHRSSKWGDDDSVSGLSSARSDLTDEWNSKKKEKKKIYRKKSRGRMVESSDEESDRGGRSGRGRSRARVEDEEGDDDDDILLDSIR